MNHSEKTPGDIAMAGTLFEDGLLQHNLEVTWDNFKLEIIPPTKAKSMKPAVLAAYVDNFNGKMVNFCGIGHTPLG